MVYCYMALTLLLKSTRFRFVTSDISGKVNMHFETNNILSHEWEACRVGSRSYKEQFIIDSVVYLIYRRRQGF